MGVFFVIGGLAFFIFRAYEEKNYKKYSFDDEYRMMLVTAFIITAALAILAGLVCIAAGEWVGVIFCLVIALYFGAFAYIIYKRVKNE